jgi:hypothetical protein
MGRWPREHEPAPAPIHCGAGDLAGLVGRRGNADRPPADRERGESLAVFDQHPEWTQGPGPLQALAANREVVDQLVGWRWSAMREAREQGHGWAEIGAALGMDAEQARQAYLERVQRQQRVHEAHPDLRGLLGYDPRWAELAEPNAADRAHQREAGRER